MCDLTYSVGLLPLGEWVSSSLSCPSFWSCRVRNLTRSCMKVLAKDVPSLEIFLAAVFLGTQVFFTWVGFCSCWSSETWFLGGDLWCLGGLGGGHLGLTWLLTPHWWHMGVLGACHFFFLWTCRCGQLGLMCPGSSQWWHVRGFLLIGSLAGGWGMKGTSASIIAFPLSTFGGGVSGITGFTKMVLEVEGVSEVGTYPTPVSSVGYFWMESMWVSFSFETLSSCNCVSNSLSSNSLIFMSIKVFSVLRLFSYSTCCLYFSLSFRNSTYWSW